jgi:hypothetical protein
VVETFSVHGFQDAGAVTGEKDEEARVVGQGLLEAT